MRSPEAHAKIVSIDTSAAKARDGVVAVYTNEDLDMEAGLPMTWVPPGVTVNTPDHWVLAKGEVKHVGDPVALVIGDDRYAVVDAAEDVVVEYEPLPVVTDPEKALEDGSPLVHEQFGTNKVCDWSLGGGDLEAGFAEADVIIERRIVNHRMAGAAIEPRGVLAEYRGDRLTVWSSTQVPHFLRLFLAILLGIGEDRVRVIAPEVGGGFGSKLQIYAEEIGCAWASRKLGRPVKWIETRSEGMMVTHHGRDQIDYVKVGAKRDGTLTAWHTKIIADIGAYQMLLTPLIPPLSAFVMCGVYNTPAVVTDVTSVHDEQVPDGRDPGSGPARGDPPDRGRDGPARARAGDGPAGAAAQELHPAVRHRPRDPDRRRVRLRELRGRARQAARAHRSGRRCAREAEALRERGHLPRDRFLDLHRDLRQCAVAGRGSRRLRAAGRRLGVRHRPRPRHRVGDAVHRHLAARPGSRDRLRADRRGPARDRSAAGRGHPRRHATRVRSDSTRTGRARSPWAARRPRERPTRSRPRPRRSSPTSSRPAPEDIELRDGKFSVRGSPDKGLTLAEAAGAAYVTMDMPEGMEPGLDEQSFYDPENFVFPFGAHACVVDVDPETGKVKVVRWVAVDDCGPAINPMLIDGQVHGGIVHGIGQALYERVHYDEAGQLVTGTFVDYALATAAELPSFETDRTETPSPVNSLAVKGVGEAGTIAATPAVTNAVIDALRPLGVDFINMPLTPMRVWEAIQEAKGGVPA